MLYYLIAALAMSLVGNVALAVLYYTERQSRKAYQHGFRQLCEMQDARSELERMLLTPEQAIKEEWEDR